MKHVALASATMLLVAAPLAAQQDSMRPRSHGPGPQCMGEHCPAPQGPRMGGGGAMGMMMMGMDGPLARTIVFNPDHLLERQAALGLTPQQAQRITQLRDAAKGAHDAQHALAMQHMEALARLAGSTDTAAVRAAFMAHHTAMGNAHWTMLRTAVQAKGVLTEVQRARVDGWVDAMQAHRAQPGGMAPGMGHGPGPHRP